MFWLPASTLFARRDAFLQVGAIYTPGSKRWAYHSGRRECWPCTDVRLGLLVYILLLVHVDWSKASFGADLFSIWTWDRVSSTMPSCFHRPSFGFRSQCIPSAARRILHDFRASTSIVAAVLYQHEDIASVMFGGVLVRSTTSFACLGWSYGVRNCRRSVKVVKLV